MDDESIIDQIMKLLIKLKHYPKYLLAERIFKDVLLPLLQKQKDTYERLFYADPDNKQ